MKTSLMSLFGFNEVADSQQPLQSMEDNCPSSSHDHLLQDIEEGHMHDTSSFEISGSTQSRKRQNELECEGVTQAVKIPYPSGQRLFKVNTPWRRDSVKSLTRKNYRSLFSSVSSESRTNTLMICQVARSITSEMKSICLDSHDSILRDTHEGIVHFSWETIWAEVRRMMPTLSRLLSATLIATKAMRSNQNMLTCLITCMLLKGRFNKMSLLQRAISVFLYGNGCTKQMYDFLQPLMVCLSHSGTNKLIQCISEDYDVAVQFWSHELQSKLTEWHQQSEQFCGVLLEDDVVESPQLITLTCDVGSGSNDCDKDYEVEEEEHEVGSEHFEDDGMSNEDLARLMDEVIDVMEHDTSDEMSLVTKWHGFKVVCDNFDKNFRRTFQRINYQTISHHFLHSYAVLDRVDLRQLSDLPRSGVIDIKKLLPTADDELQMKEFFITLILRYFSSYKYYLL
jgi:L1 cell adhesion molecule like protein